MLRTESNHSPSLMPSRSLVNSWSSVSTIVLRTEDIWGESVLLSVFIVLTDTRVMLSFSQLLVKLLSDTTGSQLLIPSCCLVFLHRPLRLIVITKTTMTIIKTSIRLITLKASKVRPLSGACEGDAVTSDTLMLELEVVEVFGGSVTTTDVLLCEERPDPSVLPVILAAGDEVEFRVVSA